jgi:hypothetical protein
MDDQRIGRASGGLRFSLKQLLKAVTVACIVLALIVWVASRVSYVVVVAIQAVVFLMLQPLLEADASRGRLHFAAAL